MSGVTSIGFVSKTLEDIKSELETQFQASFGTSIDLTPQSVFGQLIGIMAERLAEVWELGSDIYSAFSTDGASGAALDDLAGITGTVRNAATKSTVEVTAIGTNGTTLLVGREVSVTTTEVKFLTTEEKVIATLTSWAALTTYAVGDQRKNSGKVYQCIQLGTSAASGGPTTTATDITDGTVHWRFLGAGSAAVKIACEAQDTGPKVAIAGTLSVIDTAVSGWTLVTNAEDADLGEDEETDAALRIRREVELRGSGKAALEPIRDSLLAVDGVTSATVFENVTSVTDGDTLPPHSVEALVLGGTDQNVANALFSSVAAGIETYGQGAGEVDATVTDSQGFNHSVKFSRPEEKAIWIIVEVLIDPDTFPSDGEDQIKTAIVSFGDTSKTGKNAVAASLGAQAFKVLGVLDTTSVLIGLSDPPTTSATIAISARQLATYDTSRIVVNTTDGVP